MIMTSRRPDGMILALVLGLALVLAAFGGIAMLLSRSAYHEVDALQSYLDAVSIGESALAEVMARLSSTAWGDRWFRSAADVQLDVPAGRGTYDRLVRDGPAVA